MLTAMQAQNRLRRKHSASRGMRQKPGTSPTIYRAVDKPVFKPMRRSLFFKGGGGIESLVEMLAGASGLIMRKYRRSKHEKEMGTT